MITGKNKERFIQYLHKLPSDIFYYKSFGEYPFKMQIGVYLAYYDSLGMAVDIYKVYYGYKGKINGKSITQFGFVYDSRNEALTEAFKQADKLENDKLK